MQTDFDSMLEFLYVSQISYPSKQRYAHLMGLVWHRFGLVASIETSVSKVHNWLSELPTRMLNTPESRVTEQLARSTAYNE